MSRCVDASPCAPSSGGHTLLRILRGLTHAGPDFVAWLRTLRDVYDCRLLTLIICGHHFLKGFVGGGGASGLVGSGMEYHFRRHKVSGAQLQVYTSVATLPWGIKAVMGLVSDSYPLCGGYHKAPYVLLSTTTAAVAYLLAGLVFVSVQFSTLLFFIAFFQMALVDLMVEAKYAEKVKERPEHGPSLISFVWGGISLFHLFSTAIVGWVIDGYGPDACFVVAVPFAALILIPSWFDFFEEGPAYRRRQLTSEAVGELGNAGVHGGARPSEPATLPLRDSGAIVDGAEAGQTGALAVGRLPDVEAQQQHARRRYGSPNSGEERPLESTVTGGGPDAVAGAPTLKAGGHALPSPTSAGVPALALKTNLGGANNPISESHDLLRHPSNRPILYMVALVGASGVFCAGFAILVEDIFWNFVVVYAFGLVILSSYTVFLQPVIAKMNAFFFLQNVLSVSVHGAAFYFFTDTPEQYPEGPHFEPKFYVSAIGMVAAVFSLLGMAVYNKFAMGWRYRTIIVAGNLASMVLQLLNCIVFSRLNVKWGISDAYFMVCSSAIQSAVFQFGWMPGTVMLAQLVPKGLESTMYALLAGSFNLSGGMSQFSGAYLLKWLGCQPNGSKDESAQFDNLWVASLIGTLLPCLTLLLVPILIPDASQTEKLLVEGDNAGNSPCTGSLWEVRWRRKEEKYVSLDDETTGGSGIEMTDTSNSAEVPVHAPVIGRRLS